MFGKGAAYVALVSTMFGAAQSVAGRIVTLAGGRN
jgi:hypothetical protein